QDNRFLAIVGASGSGKSSLARAGLISALQHGGQEGSATWPVAICRPGPDPLESLAVAILSATQGARPTAAAVQELITGLRSNENTLPLTIRLAFHETSPAQRLVVLVDQFEEVFTLCLNSVLRAAFLANLHHAATTAGGQTLVVLTMRA